MKRTAITIVTTIMAAAGLHAQTMMDAYQFSEQNYEGTARTMAMGNAFTALGGDLGAVTINPAGSAVARYSQVTITPSVNISVNGTMGMPYNGHANGFADKYRTTMAAGSLPNIGFTLNFDTRRTKGIRNVSMGIIANGTNTYQDKVFAAGTNSQTSFLAAITNRYSGYNIDHLLADDAWDNPELPFDAILAAKAGFFDAPFNKADIPEDQRDPFFLVGATEKYEQRKDPEGNPVTDEHGNFIYDFVLADPIDQEYIRDIKGHKYDYVFNLAANISDIVFIGANIGVTSMNYSFEEIITEKSQDEFMFINQFRSARQRYTYKTSGTGVYGKFGIIVTPGYGIRLGAAIQTPTGMFLKDRFYKEGETQFGKSQMSAMAELPESEYEYRLTAPFRFNAGIAYTFGKTGLISVDYELCDYSAMRFRHASSADDSEFKDVNTDIATFMGKSHMLRVGAEVKPLVCLAIRAGYGLTTSPEMYLDENGSRQPSDNISHRYSFGLGYDTGGSMFVDIAASARMNKEYIMPYEDYHLQTPSPTIENKRTLWAVALTLGFRF